MAWYHDYFKGLPQKAWKLHQDEEYTDYEVDFLVDVLEINDQSKVLDLLSGYGRHALPIADTGCALTCIDISEEYCSELQQVVTERELNVQVICDDVLTYAYPAGFYDAAYCFGNSFSFFGKKEMQDFIGSISKAIKPGGHFAVHSENLAESIFPNYQARNWMPVKDDIIYLAENEYVAEKGWIHAEQTFISGAEKISHQVYQHIYTLSELIYMFENAGFQVTGTFADLEANTFALGDEQLYLLARKL